MDGLPDTLNGINAIDLYFLNLLNSFAHRSSIFDASVSFLSDQALLKGGLLTSVLWLAWFRPDPSQKLRRELVISTLAATITSLLLAKVFRSLLPFRLRPIHDLAIGFTLPYHVTSEALWNWSSFPSDTAAMVFALSGGLLMIWGRWGWLAILYSLIVICVPRVYLGYHYPSDIAAGALIGVLSALITGHKRNQDPADATVSVMERMLPGRFLLCFFPFDMPGCRRV